MRHPQKAIRKYLAQYAQPEAALASAMPKSIEHIVVIPSYGEGEGVLRTLRTLPLDQGAMCILVINEPTEAPSSYRDANIETIVSLEAEYGNCGSLDHDARLYSTPFGWLAVLDRRGDRAIDPSHGVGLARRVGLDLALATIVHHQLDIPWLHSTDADVRLPSDYFDVSAAIDDEVALVRRFSHALGDCESDTVLAYEAYLRLYVLGLQRVRSPFAFHTIGSLISVTPQGYAMVRGVPKRAAGEDFHFLNKLNKVGSVRTNVGSPILLSGRESSRVPFGTGPAVRNAPTDPLDYPVYHPDVFEALRDDVGFSSFDGLQTLQKLGAISQGSLAKIPLRQALAKYGLNASLQAICASLERAEHETNTLERRSG